MRRVSANRSRRWPLLVFVAGVALAAASPRHAKIALRVENAGGGARHVIGTAEVVDASTGEVVATNESASSSSRARGGSIPRRRFATR
jgi:hypothetical protein